RACEQARTIRCQARWPMRELPAAQIVCVDTHDASEHRAPADEVIRCGRGDRAWMRAVTVLEIAVSAGVDVPDVRVVDDDRIRCVDMSNVTRRMAIPRNVDFARAERKPADAATDGEGHADVRAADPANQRRRVDRSIVTRAGHPAPALTHERPTSLVNSRAPPRSANPPRPAPRCHPDPPSVSIRHPVVCDCAWAPGIAEVGLVNPIAVLVEVFVTDDIPRDIFGRSGFALATLPLVRPAFERGAWRERLGSHAERLETGEDAAHISAHDMRRPIAEDIGDAVTGLYNSLIGLRVHFDVVFPRLTQRHGDVGRLDLDRFAFRKTSHAESGRALCEAHVDDVVVKLDEAEARA